MTTDFREKRKNYYIKKKFQRDFILKFCALVALGAIISGAIIYVMSRATVTTTFENSRLTIKSTADYILPMVLISTVAVMIFVGIATVIVTLFTSHKIAGALFSIERDVERLGAGDLQTKFHLRSDDQLKPLAVGLDVMAHNLRTGVKDIKDAAVELEAAMNAAENSGVSAGLRSKLEELKAKIEKFTT